MCPPPPPPAPPPRLRRLGEGIPPRLGELRLELFHVVRVRVGPERDDEALALQDRLDALGLRRLARVHGRHLGRGLRRFRLRRLRCGPLASLFGGGPCRPPPPGGGGPP